MIESSNLAPFETVHVGGVPFRIASIDGVLAWLIPGAMSRELPVNVRLANAYNVALASERPDYSRILGASGVNFPDGTPVVWVMNARRRGARASQVRGPTLFVRALEEGQRTGARHFFLGSTPETLHQLRRNVAQRFPYATIAGMYSPPFAPLDEDYVRDCVERVVKSDPDIVWLGLGTPKQDLLGHALAQSTSLCVVNVGAAFDFVAGTLPEAPKWIQGSGFEWLFRLASEPRRLWRRYLVYNVRFMAAVLRSAREGSSGSD